VIAAPASMRNARALLVGLGANDLLAAVIAARADVVAQMHLAAHRLDCERRLAKEIVGAVHAALARRFLVLLNCHRVLLVVMLHFRIRRRDGAARTAVRA